MLQVNYDWTIFGKAQDLEKQLPNFVFNGPGLYLNEENFLLVLPNIEINKENFDKMWRARWPEDTIFQACYFAVPVQCSIIGIVVPTKSDKR